MPLFHFHFRTARGLEVDDVGVCLPDLETAYLETCEAAVAMVPDLLRDGCDPAACAFEIADAQGRPLVEVSFTEALTRRATFRPPPGSAVLRDCNRMLAEAQTLAAAARVQARQMTANVRETRRLTVEAASGGRRGSFLDAIARAYGVDGSAEPPSETRRGG